MVDEDFVDRIERAEIERRERESLGKAGVLTDGNGKVHGLDELVWDDGYPVTLDSWEAAVSTANAFNTIRDVADCEGIAPAYFCTDSRKGREGARLFAVIRERYRGGFVDGEVSIIDWLALFFEKHVKAQWAQQFVGSEREGRRAAAQKD